MQKLVILRGLPGSGKTTESLKYIKKGYKRISYDSLRWMLDNVQYEEQNEPFVRYMAMNMCDIALRSGNNVVMDDAHEDEEIMAEMLDAFKMSSYGDKLKIKVQLIKTPLEECLRRDSERELPVGKKEIMRLYNDYFKDAYQ